MDEVVDEWTGRHASALQHALRMSQEAFAEKLGVSRRAVTSWHEKPDSIIRPELQQLLDTLYEASGATVKTRFARRLNPTNQPDGLASAAPTVALMVAIAIVVEGNDVLLVCRRNEEASGITWQFPAGIVKPGGSAPTTATRETLAETGVRCAVRRRLGNRVHPTTKVQAEYFLCEYLAGEARNLDVSENVDVVWAPRNAVTRFIPSERIFSEVLHVLEASPDGNEH